MDIILTVLFKIIDYFLKFRDSGDPKKNLCQSLTKLYFLVNDFTQLFGLLIDSIEKDIKPLLNFYGDKYTGCDANEFSTSDILNITGHIKSEHNTYGLPLHPKIQNIAELYNNLNRIRNEIFDLIVKSIPLAKLGILFPEFEREVTCMVILEINAKTDSPYSVGQESYKEIQKVNAIQQLNEMKQSFHCDFMFAVNSNNDSKFVNYCIKMKDSNEILGRIRENIREFIKSNCSVADIL